MRPNDQTLLPSAGWMTVKEVCTRLSVSRSFVYACMDRGDLGYTKVGRCRRISQRDVEKYVAANYRPGRS